MSDEAHRGQYGIFADNMVRPLPTASRTGFTGTPLLSDDRIIERTLGGVESADQESVSAGGPGADKPPWMQKTEMAVVISQEQNAIQTFREWELDKEFKGAANPLHGVLVYAIWLTGFDVKRLSCLHLDKPLKAHTLMQTIAAAESCLSDRGVSANANRRQRL